MDEQRAWNELRIGITNEESIRFLDDLASDEELRRRLENNPREVLLERHIDLMPGREPDRVQLPPPEEIGRYANALRGDAPFGYSSHPPHGYAVLYVVHGNGVPPPLPPPG